MAPRQFSADRVRFFSDGVFAVLITILVLELKPPHADTFRALLPLWPTGLSYAVSYLLIAIVWLNHHHLFGYAEVATSRLLWFNLTFRAGTRPESHVTTCRDEQPRRTVCGWAC